MKKNKENKFKVRITRWVNGILSTTNTKFEEFKEAKDFVDKEKGKIKIYTPEGECIVHNHQGDDYDQYH
jgi:hypothetical protein